MEQEERVISKRNDSLKEIRNLHLGICEESLPK